MTLDVSGCLNHYEAHGVQFDYPDIWELHEEQDAEGDLLITVSTDGTCFWALRLLPACPAPSDIVNSCVAAFREEYEDVDEYPETTQLADLPAFARTLEFSCMELINSVFLASVRGRDFSLLLWWQGTDHELEEVRPVFEQMARSVRICSLLDHA